MDEAVLVLNANYEPLNVCNTKRAVGLMMTGKAEMIINGRGEIRTVSRSFPAPSVVRLSRMISRPRPRVKLTKKEIFRRDHHTCQYCGRKQDPSELTIDHIMPRYRGGAYSWENLVTSCSSCNRRKGGRTPLEANMRLKRQPTEPHASAEYMFGHLLNRYSEWATYIKGW